MVEQSDRAASVCEAKGPVRMRVPFANEVSFRLKVAKTPSAMKNCKAHSFARSSCNLRRCGVQGSLVESLELWGQFEEEEIKESVHFVGW